MPLGLSGCDFLKMLDLSSAQIQGLVDLSAWLKGMKHAGEPHRFLEGKNIVLLFEKTSTRTRSSFEVAGRDLGMGVVCMDEGSSQMGRKESIADTARVLCRMYDGIEYRGFGQEIVEELAEFSSVPVWNGLTNESHPTQMIADLLTVEEFPGRTCRSQACLHGRRAEQCRELADGRLRENGHAFRRLWSRRADA